MAALSVLSEWNKDARGLSDQPLRAGMSGGKGRQRENGRQKMDATKTNPDLVQIKFFLGFIAAVIIFFVFKYLGSLFIPIFMALFLYFLLNKVFKKLVSFKIPKFIVVILFLIVLFALFYFLGVLVFASLSSFVEKYPEYSNKIVSTFRGLAEKINIPGLNVNRYIQQIDWSKGIDTSAVTSILYSIFGSFTSFIGYLTLVLLFLMFMLTGEGDLAERISSAFSDKRGDKIKEDLGSLEDQVYNYLVTKIYINLITAIGSGIIIYVGGFDFVLLSVLIIFILNFIPDIGAIISAIFPIFFGFLKFGFSLRWFLVLAAIVVFQFTLGNVVAPKVTGKGLNLSPIVILASLIFWGYLWGFVGAILAVPLLAALKIFFEKIPALSPLAKLISEE